VRRGESREQGHVKGRQIPFNSPMVKGTLWRELIKIEACPAVAQRHRRYNIIISRYDDQTK